MDLSVFIMDPKISNSDPKKRKFGQSPDRSWTAEESTFPRFIVLEALDSSKKLADLNPFVVEKQINSLIGTAKSVKKLRNGCLLVEVGRSKQADTLLNISQFFSIPAKGSSHKTLNSSKGVIRCPDLDGTPDSEIAQELKSKNVSSAKRVIVKRQGKQVPTSTYILTFSTPVLPPTIRIGYLNVKVDIFVPNPMQCYNCYKFGHHENNCVRAGICRRCGTGHDNMDTCTRDIVCANCGGDHYATSRTCKSWVVEKEILSLKYKSDISFAEARKIVDSWQTPVTSTYAKAASQKVQMVDFGVQCNMCDCTALQTIAPKSQTQSASVQTQSVTAPKATPQKQTSQNKTSSPDKQTVKLTQKTSPRKRITVPERVKKAERGPITTSNRFDQLDEDVGLMEVGVMEDEDMGLSQSSTPAQGRSPIKYP